MTEENQKGEYFDRIEKIVTVDEAWTMILTSDKLLDLIDAHMALIHNPKDEDYMIVYDQAKKDVIDMVKNYPITSFPGYCIRLDGQVEIEAKSITNPWDKEGERFERVLKVIPIKEAWEEFFSSDKFNSYVKSLSERQKKLTYDECEKIEKLQWRTELGINAIDGYYLRSDGQVEVEAND